MRTVIVALSLFVIGTFCTLGYSTPFPNVDGAFVGPVSPSGCTRYINWSVQPPPTGTWSYGFMVHPRCETIEAAGARGWLLSGFQTPINESDQLGSKLTRIRQAFRNIGQIISQYDATYADVTHVFVNTHDIVDIRPLVNQVQAEDEFWGPQVNYTLPVYPERAIFGISQFNGITCRRVDRTIYQGVRGPSGQVLCADPSDSPIGDIIEVGFSFNYPRGAGPSWWQH